MRLSALLVFASLWVSACGRGAPASAVSPSPVSGSALVLSGTWSGTSSDSAGSQLLGCALTQSGNAVTGTTSISDTKRTMMGSGTMQGTMTGTGLTFHLSVPSGGFSGMMGPCSMGLDASAAVSADGRTMTGTYSGTMSGTMSSGMMSQMQACGGPMNNGHFTLTR